MWRLGVAVKVVKDIVDRSLDLVLITPVEEVSFPLPKHHG
jgi:hypothetical protein